MTSILLQRGDIIQLAAAAQSNGGQEQDEGGEDKTPTGSAAQSNGGQEQDEGGEDKTPTGSAAASDIPRSDSSHNNDSSRDSSSIDGSHKKHHTKSHSKQTSSTEDIDALNNEGNALYLLGDYNGAIQHYDKVLAIDPKNIAALTNKGVALDDLGNPTQAIQYYDKVLAIDPKNIAAINNKGAALGKLGRNEEAIANFDKVLGLEANTAGVSYNQNEASSNSIRYSENVQYSTKVLKFKFDYISLLDTSKNMYMYEEPTREYHISLSKESENVIIAETNKGIALYNIERYQEAIANFDKVLLKVPDYVGSLYYKGLCLEKIGKVNEAIAFKDKAAKMNAKYKGGFIKIVVTQSPLNQIIRTP